MRTLSEVELNILSKLYINEPTKAVLHHDKNNSIIYCFHYIHGVRHESFKLQLTENENMFDFDFMKVLSIYSFERAMDIYNQLKKYVTRLFDDY